mmetsp:Transcript_8562/g.20999  ORF Transcript_8562/g.20999 Transcript_8562/m.20999 type:complete len:327 (+) Transcript_8562:1313-2293(+)
MLVRLVSLEMLRGSVESILESMSMAVRETKRCSILGTSGTNCVRRKFLKSSLPPVICLFSTVALSFCCDFLRRSRYANHTPMLCFRMSSGGLQMGLPATSSSLSPVKTPNSKGRRSMPLLATLSSRSRVSLGSPSGKAIILLSLRSTLSSVAAETMLGGICSISLWPRHRVLMARSSPRWSGKLESLLLTTLRRVMAGSRHTWRGRCRRLLRSRISSSREVRRPTSLGSLSSRLSVRSSLTILPERPSSSTSSGMAVRLHSEKSKRGAFARRALKMTLMNSRVRGRPKDQISREGDSMMDLSKRSSFSCVMTCMSKGMRVMGLAST